jgi:DNA-binding NarL/FixJ family response regulator
VALAAISWIAWSLRRRSREVVILREQLEEVRNLPQPALKGFSLKEIAALRGTSEKTIRQQASSVYKKAGLSGRHAFSAWFIEDIL